MEFWKMNGAGNDFILLNNLEEKRPEVDFPRIAKILCERHLSIGADGLMVISTPSEGGDFKMGFYNSDGTVGEMCGNGARCICRYGYETGLSGETQTIETTAGIVTGKRINSRYYRIRLNDPTTIELNHPVNIDGKTFDCSYIELGKPGLPHAVVPYPDLANADSNTLRELGRKIRWHKSFSKGANVNFYEVIGDNLVFERTFERGVEDFTYACGTGTGSVATVLTLLEKVSPSNIVVQMQGGELTVDVVQENNKIADLFLTGPTNIVAKGIVTDEDLI